MKKLRLLVIMLILSLSSIIFVGCNNVNVESVEFNKSGPIVLVEGTEIDVYSNILLDDSKLIATALPKNATNRKIFYSIDNTSIAKISNNKITALSEGVTYLTASAQDGKFPTSIAIKVVKQAQQLSKVSNIRFENSKLVWDKVENADYYTISLNNANAGSTIIPEFTSFEVGSLNIVKITAYSTGTAYTQSAESDLYIFKQLVAPTDLTNNEYTVEWSSISDATGYDVYVNNQKVNSSKVLTNSYTLEPSIFSSANSCTVNIVAVGEGNVFNSNLSQNFVLTRQDAPSIIELKQGTIMFNAVANVTKYEVKIDNDVYLSETTSFAVPTEVEGGFHTATIKTLSTKSGYVSSEYSQTSLNFSKLNTVSNISLNNNIVSWSSVENASGYLLNIEYEGNTKFVDLGTLSSFEIGEDYGAGEYKISIASTGSGTQYVKSNFSAPLTLTKLHTPQNFGVTNGKIKFNAVENAKEYLLNINGEERIVSPDLAVDNVFSLDVELEVGNYNIKVMSRGDNKTYLNSVYSNSIKTTKIEKPQQPFIQEGIIKWRDIPNCYGYNVKINNEIYEFNTLEIKSGYVQLDLSGNEFNNTLYSVQVQAIASLDNISSDYSEANVFKKYESPKEVKALNGLLAFDYYEEALEYCISIDNVENIININDSNLTEDNNLNPSFYLYDAKLNTYRDNLEIKVRVYGNNEYISSCYSEPKQFSMCKAITELNIENNVLSFQKNSEGDIYAGYSVEFSSGRISKEEKKLTSQTVFNLPHFLDEKSLTTGKYTFSFIPQGDSINTLNGVESTISTYILQTPSNLEIHNGTLCWATDNNSTSYLLNILDENGQPVRQIESYSNSVVISNYSDLMENIKYYAKIQIVGDGHNTISSDFTDDVDMLEFVILSAPTEIEVKDGKLTWEDIANSTGYGIYIDDVLYENVSKDREILQKGIPSGTHTIKLIAYGDEYYANSKLSSEFNVVKLEAPDTINVSKDTETNIVNFNCNFPTYAEKVKISKSYNNSEFNDEEFELEENKNGIKIDLTDYVSGYYSFKAVALGDNTKYLNSNESKVVATTVMTSPDMVYLNNGVIYWTDITGRLSYTLKITKDNDNVTFVKDIKQNSYVIPEEYQAGEYRVAVQVIGDDSKFITSVMGSDYQFTKLGVVNNLDSYNGEIIFNTLEGANSYEIYVDNEKAHEVSINNDNIISLESVDYLTVELPQEVKAGEHLVSVKAIGDNSNYLTGDISQAINVYKLDIVKNYRLEDGIVRWTPITEANGYNIQINSIKYENSYENESDSDILIKNAYYDLINSTSTENNISLKAVGRKYQGRNILNSNYTEDISAIKLASVKNLKAHYDNNLKTTGSLVWDKVENSFGYLVEITDNTNKVTQIIVEEEMCGIEDTQIAQGNVTIRVRAIGNSTDESSIKYYLSGEYSNEKTFAKLDTPSNFRIEDGYLVWDSSDYSDFIVSLTPFEEEEILQEVLENKMLLDENFIAGSYSIKVKAKGLEDTNSLNSSYTEEIEAIKPEMPTNITVDEYGIVRWNLANNAENYIIRTAYKTQSDLGDFDGNEEMTNNQTPFSDFYYLGLSGRYRFNMVSVSKHGLISDSTDIIEFTLNGFKYGSGTEDEPYYIQDELEFERASHYVYGHFMQMVDLDFSNKTIMPMFTDNAFMGSYSGETHSISNLTMTNISVNNLGLFANVGATGRVENINFRNIDLRFNAPYAGIIGTNRGLVSNINIDSSSTVSVVSNEQAGDIYVGAIVGNNTKTGKIQKCSSSATSRAIVSFTNENSANCAIYSGGVCASNYGQVYMCSTTQNAFITGNTSGGICAVNYGKVEASINNAKVTAINKYIQGEHRNAYAGGIVGENSCMNGEESIIISCINNGLIYCENNSEITTSGYTLYACGIAGLNRSVNENLFAKIKNCYNSVDVVIKEGTDSQYYSNNLITLNYRYAEISYVYYVGSARTIDGLVSTTKVTEIEDVNEVVDKQYIADKLNINAGDGYRFIVDNEQVKIVENV